MSKMRIFSTVGSALILLLAFSAVPAGAQETEAASDEATEPTAAEAATEPAEAEAEQTEEKGETGGFTFSDDEWESADSYTKEGKKEGEGAIADLLEDPEWEGVRFDLDGYYRIRWTDLEEPDLDADADPQRMNFWQHRLRLLPTISLNDKTRIKLDLVVGQGLHPCQGAARVYHPSSCKGMWGANGTTVLDTQLSDAFSNITLARFWGEVTTPIGVVRAGRQPSHWGLGLFSNDGMHESEFGDAKFGDTYDRLTFATKPMGPDSDLVTALIYDMISEGSRNSGQPAFPSITRDADDIHEGVLVLLYTTAPLDFGVYQVARYQKDPRNYIWATDVYGRLDIGLLYGAFEMVWLYGSTRAVPVFDQANLEVREGEKVWIDTFGWAGELGLRFDWYDVKLKLGSAQGDNTSINDGKVSSITFKPDYNVGLIMFEHAYANLVERQLQAQFAQLDALAQAGVISSADIQKLQLATDLARTKGGITNAFYLNPIATFEPLKDLETRVGVVWAEANDPVAILGSGANAKRAYGIGWEIDAGITYTWRDAFSVGAEGGVFFPGDAFDRAQTTVDPASGLEVQLGDETIPADNAYFGQFRLTYHID